MLISSSQPDQLNGDLGSDRRAADAQKKKLEVPVDLFNIRTFAQWLSEHMHIMQSINGSAFNLPSTSAKRMQTIKNTKKELEDILKIDSLIRRQTSRFSPNSRTQASFAAMAKQSSRAEELANDTMATRTDVSDYGRNTFGGPAGELEADVVSLRKTQFALDYGCGDPYYMLKAGDKGEVRRK